MCEAVMCEDIAGYYKRGPLYFNTSQSSLAFLQHSSEAQPDQPRSLLLTQGAFIIQFAFFLFYVLPCVIGFRAHRLAKAVCSQ